MIARIPFGMVASIPFDDQQLSDLMTAKALDPSPGATIELTWGEIVRGAVLCGVPDWQARRRHGRIGKQEIWRRASHLLSHLEVRREGGTSAVYRTEIYESEDGSEKMASSYLIGMAVALAVARKDPGMKALVHYDSIHGARGTRPDLVDVDNPDSVFVEVKGRYRAVSQSAMTNAVAQLQGHALRNQTTNAHAIAAGFVGGRLQVHRQVYDPPHLTRPVRARAAVGHVEHLRPWEPLALAIVAAVADGQYGLLGRTETAEGTYLHLRNDVLGLTIGLVGGLFEAVVGNLIADGSVGDDPWPRIEEIPYVSAEELRGTAVSDDLLIAWSPDAGHGDGARRDG